MLNTEERVEGMLLHLAKLYPQQYVAVGRRRKLSMEPIVLNTSQTIALARVGKLNDTCMTNVRSFLRQVGKVKLQMSLKEQQRIDWQVGYNQTKDVTFSNYFHEWSLFKGKETKAPEQVHYWNSQLSKEIEAEVDLYLHRLFIDNPERNTIPSIDYQGDGFESVGVTVLFGGVHGDKHHPISCKINLCPPAKRKNMKQLGYQCPTIQFASVECSKDSYELMNNTVMPMVKEQLIKLKKSSIVTVYHIKKPSNVF
jgi:hypothetical protein